MEDDIYGDILSEIEFGMWIWEDGSLVGEFFDFDFDFDLDDDVCGEEIIDDNYCVFKNEKVWLLYWSLEVFFYDMKGIDDKCNNFVEKYLLGDNWELGGEIFDGGFYVKEFLCWEKRRRFWNKFKSKKIKVVIKVYVVNIVVYFNINVENVSVEDICYVWLVFFNWKRFGVGIMRFLVN